jgi:hypothetical protein
LGARQKRIAAILVLGVWSGIGGCTLFDPLSGLEGPGSSSEGGGDGSIDAPQGDDVRSEDSPSPSDVPVSNDSPTTGFQRTVTVTAADAVSSGYVVRFQLDTASLVSQGKMRSDLNDLRVFGPTGELDRIVDTGAPSFVWFAITLAIPSGASGTYSVHYGNPSAGPAPAKGSNVFSFYDDFTGSAVSTQWITLGSPTVSGGTVRLHAWDADASPDPDSMRTNPQTDNVQAASWLQINATVTNPASPADAVNGFWYWIGFQRQGDFTASLPWVLWISRQKNQVWAEDVDVDASFNGGALGQDTQPHAYVIARAPSSTSFYRDGAQAYSTPYGNSTDYALMLRNYTQSSDVVVSLVRDRPLVDNEPTVTVGAEKPLP